MLYSRVTKVSARNSILGLASLVILRCRASKRNIDLLYAVL